MLLALKHPIQVTVAEVIRTVSITFKSQGEMRRWADCLGGYVPLEDGIRSVTMVETLKTVPVELGTDFGKVLDRDSLKKQAADERRALYDPQEIGAGAERKVVSFAGTRTTSGSRRGKRVIMHPDA